MRLILSSLDRRAEERRRHDRAIFEWVTGVVEDGGLLEPAGRPEE
jgi:hypothetical protein